MCQPPPAIKKRRRKLWHIAFKVLVCASSPTGPIQCPSTNFQRSECWLLAASHCFSLKAGSDRLACFVLSSSLQGGSVVILFFILSLFPGCKIHPRLNFCTSAGNRAHLQVASIFLCFFSPPPQSKFLLLGLLNTPPPGRTLHVSGLYQREPGESRKSSKYRHTGGDLETNPDASPVEVRREELKYQTRA